MLRLKVSTGDTVMVQLPASPELVVLHTNFNLADLHSHYGVQYAHFAAEVAGIEPYYHNSTFDYQLTLNVGLLFDRAAVAKLAAIELLKLAVFEADAAFDETSGELLFEEIEATGRRPFTVIGAHNNSSTLGPQINGDGEIKVERRAVWASSRTEAEKLLLAYLNREKYRQDPDEEAEQYPLLDQCHAFEGNPMSLEVEDMGSWSKEGGYAF